MRPLPPPTPPATHPRTGRRGGRARAAQLPGRAAAALVVAHAVTACGGGEGGRPPEPVVRPPALTGAAVSPGAAEVPLDSAVALRVDPTWSAGGTSATPATTVTWTRRGTAAGAVTADAGDGRAATYTAVYRAGGVGTDTLEATVTPAGGGAAVTARAVVAVRGPRVARVAYPAAVAYVGVGAAFALPAAGLNAAGAPVAGAVVAYRVLDGSGVAVGSDGTLTGQGAGTARVVAEAYTVAAAGAALPADTLAVVVAGDAASLSLALADTLAQGGRPLAVVGVGAAALAATLDGQALPARTTARGAVLTVPTGLFAPCRPLGATAPLTLTSAGHTRTLALPVYAPLTVALAPGEHRRVTEAAAGGCPVAVDAAGTYVVMPFAWDRAVPQGGTAGPGTPPSGATTALIVAAGPAPDGVPGAPAVATLAAARLARPAIPPRGRTGGVAAWATPLGALAAVRGRGDVLDLHPGRAQGAAAPPVRRSVAAAAAAGCPVPTAVGATVPIGTYRAPDGRFLQVASPRGGGGVVEPWTLAAIRPSVAVLFDTALVRARGGLGDWQARLDAFADGYEATLAPLLAEHTAGVADADGNGRVVVLVALRAGSAYAYPTGYARDDCEGAGFVLGEAVSLAGDAFVGADHQAAPALSVAAHESAHLVDNSLAYVNAGGTLRQDTWWSREGYAVLVQWLWTLPAGEVAQAFTAGRATPAYRTVLGTPQGGFCERPDRAVLARWYALSADAYPLACQATRYALSQLAHAQSGLATKQLLDRWSALRDRRRLADAVNGLLAGTPLAGRPAQDVAGAFALSWAADGVAGAAAETQDYAADVRALARVWYPTLAVPAATLAPGQRLAATLGEPDALHVEAALPARGWLAVTGAGGGGLPTDRADVLLVRLR